MDSRSLFEEDVPRGFHYRADFITDDDEGRLLDGIREVAFADFEMRGVVARRRVAFFGQSYDRAAVGRFRNSCCPCARGWLNGLASLPKPSRWPSSTSTVPARP